MMMSIPVVFAAINDAQTESITQNISGITSSGNYTANTTLGHAPYQNSIGSIKTITSNTTLDAPTSYAYNSVSRVLTVSGLAETGLTRTLAVQYNIADSSLPDYFTGFLDLLHWFYILMIVGLAGGGIYAFFQT